MGVARICFKVTTVLSSEVILEGDTFPFSTAALSKLPTLLAPTAAMTANSRETTDQKLSQSAQEKLVVEGGREQDPCLAKLSGHRGGVEVQKL
jgi:hypothetical protein